MIGPLSAGLITALLAQYGQETVAGFGIASRLEGLVVIPLFALSASIGPFVGQNWGAKAFLRANEAMRLTFQWSLLWGAVVAVLLYLLRYPLIHQFDSTPSVADVAADYLVILPISYGAWGIIMMTSAIFNALGHPLRSTILSIARMFLIYLPLAYLLSAWLDAVGVFLAAAAANVIVAIVGYFWNRSTFGVKLDKEAERA
jgi:Na+-driven multidrug efflux pump